MQETENEELSVKCIDDYTLIRYKIISRTYFIKSKDEEESSKSEEYDLPKLPPPKLNKENVVFSDTEYNTELENLLQEDRPGLLDSNWVQQVREAYKESPDPLKVDIFVLRILIYYNFLIFLLSFYKFNIFFVQ